MFRTSQQRTSHHYWQVLAIASLTIAVLSFVSPQIGTLGHGLRTALPALAVAWVAITRLAPQAFWLSFKRFRSFFLLGCLFLLQATLRFLYDDNKLDLFDRYVLNPLTLSFFLLWIGALAELGQKTLNRFRVGILFGWSLSLALGVPELLANPGVAKWVMGNVDAEQNASIYAPLGVGSYTTYTFLAICFVPMFVIIQKVNSTIWRWCNIVLLILASLGVFLSTFSMASTLLAISIFFCTVNMGNDGTWPSSIRQMFYPPAAIITFTYRIPLRRKYTTN